jgi:hypothetical protein
VDLGRPVDADPDQEAVPGQELAPFVGEQGAIGLDGVLETLAGTSDRLRRLDGPPEEVDPHKGGLTALPQ